MAFRMILSRLAAVAAGTALVCGCGTASKPASSGSGRVPTGFTLYHGNGFSLAVPRGFAGASTSLPGLPTGITPTDLTPGGIAAEKANAQILLFTNSNLQFTIDQVASNLREADSTNPSLSDVHTSVGAMTVAGAQEARIVTERYVGTYVAGQPAKGPFQRTWLMVLPKPGTLIDVVVVVEPGRGGSLDPNTVFDSFRLAK